MAIVKLLLLSVVSRIHLKFLLHIGDLISMRASMHVSRVCILPRPVCLLLWVLRSYSNETGIPSSLLCINRNSWFVVHFTGYSADERLLWFTMWYSIKCFYTFITYIYIYISYFTNYSGKFLVKLTLSRHIACGYSFCSKILLSQNWTGSDILESLDISVNITQQIYYDGYRRVNM